LLVNHRLAGRVSPTSLLSLPSLQAVQISSVLATRVLAATREGFGL